MKKSVLGLGALVCAVALLALGGVAQAATVRYVSKTGEDTGNNCATEATPCATIGQAVAEASAGDTVKVGAGFYEEAVTVDKSLTLLAAQAGVDARTRDEGGLQDAAESIISDPSGSDLTLSSGSVTVDGFKFETPANEGNGIFLIGATNNVIRNDIFSGISGGYGVNGEFEGSTLRHNRVENTRIGFQSDLALAPNVTVDANKFVSTAWYDLAFLEGGTEDVVSNNESTGETEANFLALFKAHGAKITGNLVTERKSSAFYLGGSTVGTVISGNTVTGVKASGVSVYDEVGAPNRSFEVVENTFTGNVGGVRLYAGSSAGVVEVHSNRISGNTGAGIINEGEADLDATANWWGCDAGPNQGGCDKATGPMDSSKWLVLTLSASPNQIYKSVGSTQLTASLTRDAAGEVVGSVPGSTPVAFASTMGSVGAAEPTLDGGRATAQLTAPSSTGTADATATVDGTVVHASVEVIEAPKGETGATGATGAKGETGGKGSSSESSVALKRKMSLKFIGGKATVSGDVAAVKVRCLGSTAKRCVGTLTLKVGGKSAKASYSVAAGKSATVKVPLADEGATDRAASTAASATARTLQTSGGAVTTKKSLHLR